MRRNYLKPDFDVIRYTMNDSADVCFLSKLIPGDDELTPHEAPVQNAFEGDPY